MRENFFNADSVFFKGLSKEVDKEIEIYIFKYILSVLLMRPKDLDETSKEKIKILLTDMELFADLVVRAHQE